MDSDGVVVGGQKVPTGTVLWGAGVIASPAGRWLRAETDKSGKIMVEPNLSVRERPEVFAIGDTAHLVAPVRNMFGIKSPTLMLMPGVAQPAIQEGRYVADVIRRRVAGRGQTNSFWCWDKGEIAIVGRSNAVAHLRFAQFADSPAWLVWAGVHISFLIGFANRLFVSLQWGLAFLTKRRRVLADLLTISRYAGISLRVKVNCRRLTDRGTHPGSFLLRIVGLEADDLARQSNLT